MILTILITFGLMLLGYAVYVLFKALTAGYFNGYNSWFTLGISAAFMLVISVLLVVVPESVETIKTLTGLDLAATDVGFVSLGVALAALVRNSRKKRKNV